MLEGIVYSITEDFDRINDLLFDAIYTMYCFCFSDVSELSNTFPAVDMVFSNGQKLSLSPENYLFRVSNGLVCMNVMNLHILYENKLSLLKSFLIGLTHSKCDFTILVVGYLV